MLSLNIYYFDKMKYISTTLHINLRVLKVSLLSNYYFLKAVKIIFGIWETNNWMVSENLLNTIRLMPNKVEKKINNVYIYNIKELHA